jgi:hypothetical protein
MQKKYKYYVTRREKIFFFLFILIIIAGSVWIIWQNKYYLFLTFLGPIGTYLFYPFSYILTADNMLDVRHLFGSSVKPFSLNQITRITQKSKNEVILVYNRDGLRGDRLLRLSETDMKDFMNELLQRNPAIEIFASNS